MPGQRRKFTTEFKKQMVQLYENGKSRAFIVEEYDLTASALDRWIKQAQKQVPFQRRIIALRKKMSFSHCEKRISD